MGAHIQLRNPTTGEVKSAPTGFSWTTWFFQGIPAFVFRGDRSSKSYAMLMVTLFDIFLLVVFGTIALEVFPLWTLLSLVGWVFVALHYNRWYVRGLLQQGYLPNDGPSKERLVRDGIDDGEMMADRRDEAIGQAAARMRRPANQKLEAYILHRAAEEGGIVSPISIARAGEYGLEEAKDALDRLVESGYAEFRMVKKTGVTVYVIAELLDGRRGEELEQA